MPGPYLGTRCHGPHHQRPSLQSSYQNCIIPVERNRQQKRIIGQPRRQYCFNSTTASPTLGIKHPQKHNPASKMPPTRPAYNEDLELGIPVEHGISQFSNMHYLPTYLSTNTNPVSEQPITKPPPSYTPVEPASNNHPQSSSSSSNNQSTQTQSRVPRNSACIDCCADVAGFCCVAFLILLAVAAFVGFFIGVMAAIDAVFPGSGWFR